MKQVLSPKDLAEAIGVSESSLKRWADEGRVRVSRTAGGHRRISLSDAIRFIRESRAPLVRPDILGFPEIGATQDDDDAPSDDADRLYAYLSEGRALESRGFLLSRYLSGRSVAELCDGPVREAMTRIGRLWLDRDDGVYVEHRATDIVLQSLMQLRSTLPRPESELIAVGGAPSGDPYVLPTLAASMVLESEGIRAINLGADTPLSCLAAAAEEYGAVIVWLSVTSEIAGPGLGPEVASLASSLGARQVSLVIGGRRHESFDAPTSDHVRLAPTLRELAAFARGMLTAARQRA